VTASRALSIAIVLHVFLLVYWLGGDLGTYYSSRYVMKREVGLEARSIALKIMSFCDVFPRICLVLFLPSGITLMGLNNLGRDQFGGWRLIPVWIFGFAWLSLVIYEYRSHGVGKHITLIRNADLIIRYLLIVGLLIASSVVLVIGDPFGVQTNPRWLAGKVMLYAIAILMGVLIRRELKPFGAAWVALVRSGKSPGSDEIESGIGGAIERSEKYVYLIWVCVIGAAILGVVKPGIMNYS